MRSKRRKNSCGVFNPQRILVVLGAVLMLSVGMVSTASAANPLSWSVVNVDGSNPIYGISCPSTKLCAATDGPGNVLTSTNPTGGASAWTTTNVAVEEHRGGEKISCPSENLCVATEYGKEGEFGNVVTSTNPTGGASAWTTTNVSVFGGIEGISCPTVGLCIGIEAFGGQVTSTNPTGGASAWTLTRYVGGGSLRDLLRLACPSESLCLAGDNEGNILTSIDPAGGASTWTVSKVDNSTYNGIFGNISCPTIDLCVASDAEGNILTSTNPTGGASAWSVVKLSVQIASLSCISTTDCFAFDYEGKVLTSTNPTGGASAWTVTNEGDSIGNFVNNMTCPSEELCVAVDAVGNVVVGSTKAGPSLPVNTKPPTITGTTTQGQGLTEVHGEWSNSPTEYSYQWERCSSTGGSCAAITGETTQSYKLTAADVGYTVRVGETAKNSAGAGTPAASVTTAVVQAEPAPKEEPKEEPPHNGGGGSSGGGSTGGSGGGGTIGPGGGTTPPPVVKCIVPKLKGKTLTQARKLLTKTHCSLGKVTKPKGHTKHKQVVAGQKPATGKVLPSGAKVAVNLR